MNDQEVARLRARVEGIDERRLDPPPIDARAAALGALAMLDFLAKSPRMPHLARLADTTVFDLRVLDDLAFFSRGMLHVHGLVGDNAVDQSGAAVEELLQLGRTHQRTMLALLEAHEHRIDGARLLVEYARTAVTAEEIAQNLAAVGEFYRAHKESITSALGSSHADDASDARQLARQIDTFLYRSASDGVRDAHGLLLKTWTQLWPAYEEVAAVGRFLFRRDEPFTKFPRLLSLGMDARALRHGKRAPAPSKGGLAPSKPRTVSGEVRAPQPTIISTVAPPAPGDGPAAGEPRVPTDASATARHDERRGIGSVRSTADYSSPVGTPLGRPAALAAPPPSQATPPSAPSQARKPSAAKPPPPPPTKSSSTLGAVAAPAPPSAARPPAHSENEAPSAVIPLVMKPGMRGDERPSDGRKAPRVEVTLRMAVGTDADIGVGVTENLSQTGLFLACASTRPLGTRLALHISHPALEGPLKLSGVVRWIRPADPQARFPKGMGIEFEQLSDEERTILARLVELANAAGGASC